MNLEMLTCDLERSFQGNNTNKSSSKKKKFFSGCHNTNESAQSSIAQSNNLSQLASQSRFSNLNFIIGQSVHPFPKALSIAAIVDKRAHQQHHHTTHRPQTNA
jgi:hypothetical protein